MQYIEYILKIILYFVYAFTIYSYLKRYSKKNANNYDKKKKRISFFMIIIFSILLGLYSIICGHNPPVSDRGHYSLMFVNDGYIKVIKADSLGLYWIYTFLHLFTHSKEVLFFFITFLYIFLILIAYLFFDDVEPFAILLFFLSECGYYGFIAFKQCIAIALIAISFVAFMKKKKVLFVLSMALAICFHEASWIMVPLYIAAIGSKSKIIRSSEYIFLLFFAILFNKINPLLISIFNNIPGLGEQLVGYLNDSGGIETSINYLTFIKGMPFYIITFYAFLKRKKLKDKIYKYDTYLLFSTFSSICSITSIYMYWMWRFSAPCYLPTFVFTSLIYREMDNEKEKRDFKLLLIVVLFALALKALIQYYFKYGGF